MSDEGQRAEQSGAAPTASPTISTFPTGSAEQGLKEIRTRLLDLTNRNKLLNFRFPPASCLRFVNLDMDGAFNRIMDEDKLFLSAVSELPYGHDDLVPHFGLLLRARRTCSITSQNCARLLSRFPLFSQE